MTLTTPTTTAASSPSTTWRLLLGATAGPLWLVIGFVQIPFNPGFDLTEHAFSYLSIGPTGEVQIANFICAGVLLVVAATALAGVVPGRKGKVAAGVLGAWGVAKIASGVFTVDPSFGFPPGAPAGMPAQLSGHAALHGFAFATSVILWVILLIVLGSVFRERMERSWAVSCRVAAVGLLLVPPLSFGPNGAVAIYVGVTFGYLFFAGTLLHLRRPALAPRGRFPA